MARTRQRKNAAPDKRRVMKKKVSILTTDRVDWIDYKDVDLLRRFMSERAKIRARRVTGNDSQQQREVARAIKNAREMALLPYTTRVTTQRKVKSNDNADRGAEPAEVEAPPVDDVVDAADGADLAEVDA
jgi:small subunit ribosomal protein S18